MSHIRGLKTREMVWVLGGSANDYMERAYYYDSDGRLCQRVEKYPDGNIVRTSLAYDFAGDITARCEEHSCTDGAEHLYYTEYAYDHRGRMTGMTRSFEGEQLAAVSYSYDALGRLSGKTITSDTPSGVKTGTESIGYDIRGWNTGSSALYCGTQLFGEMLRYTSSSKPGVAARWNGNISEAAYYSPSSVHTFGYAYDAHNRLSGARHFIGNAMTESNTMTEKDITYDRNGNVTGLKRYMTNGMRDELVFTHAGNLVTQWTDVYNTDNGYYDYDGNGNRIHDGHTNLDYSYNILNLPQSVTNAMNQSVTYKYLADGTKISAMNGDGEGKEYRGTFVYDKHSAEGCDWAELSSIAWEEGRIVVEPGSDVGVDSLVVDSLYVEDFPIEGEEIVVDSTAVVPFYLHDLWYVKDHLGSVRSVVLLGENYSGTAALVEQNDYYPFGTRIAGTAGAAADSLDYANRDRFCGKEEQDFSPSLNLHLLDFGARYYDPFTCRWTTQDPLSEKYYSLSPYNYCANTPICHIDPKGDNDYFFDEYGNLIVLETVDPYDMVIAGDNSFLLMDKTIMDAYKDLDKKKHHFISGKASSSAVLEELFYFLSDNTKVEWVLHSFKDGQSILGTIHSTDSAGTVDDYLSLLSNWNGDTEVAKIHSHPGIAKDITSELDSMGYPSSPFYSTDWTSYKNQYMKLGDSAPKSYVYFPNSKRIYSVTENKPLLFKTR